MIHTMYGRIRDLLRHYFVPHESNNWRAKSLHPRFLLFYILVLVFVQARFSFPGVAGDVLGYATDISAQRLLELVNVERAKANVPPLVLSTELSQAATGKAGDMFAKNYWAHISPTGETPWAFITRAGYQYIYAGENLAKSFNTSEEVVAAWMNSPAHRANILKPEYREIGFAIQNGSLRGEQTTLVVQEFGTRTSTTPIAKTVPSDTEPAPAASELAEAPPEVALVEEVKDANDEPEPTGSIALANSDGVLRPETAPVSRSPMWFSLGTTKTMSVILAETLLLLLCFDAVYIWRHRTVRTSGHTLSHIVFFLMLLGAMGAAGVGAIL